MPATLRGMIWGVRENPIACISRPESKVSPIACSAMPGAPCSSAINSRISPMRAYSTQLPCARIRLSKALSLESPTEIMLARRY